MPMLLFTAMVQLKELPKTRLPLMLSVLATVKSGATVTVLPDVFDVTPLAVADAVFVTKPAATSLAVTV